jgi:hypothetical protein
LKSIDNPIIDMFDNPVPYCTVTPTVLVGEAISLPKYVKGNSKNSEYLPRFVNGRLIASPTRGY